MDPSNDWPGKDQRRILHQLDRMVSAGRITPDDAERLRAANNADAFQVVLGEIMTRHAGASIDESVADGRMTRAEADEALHRLSRGEHTPGLRKHLRQLRRLHRRSSDGQ